MATVIELIGRESENRQGIKVARRLFAIEGASDEDDARDTLEASLLAPATLGSMTRQVVRVRETEVEDGTTGMYEGVVEYALPEYSLTTARRSFRTTGKTRRILQSLATVYASSGAYDHEGAIGVTEDGDVEGVEIEDSETEMSLTFSKVVDVAYIETLEGLLKHTNNAAFEGFATGTVLFVGYDISDRDDGTSEVSLAFKLAANVASTTLATYTFAKAAHDYVWVQHARVAEGGKLGSKPQSVYVERVYESGDFSGLAVP